MFPFIFLSFIHDSFVLQIYCITIPILLTRIYFTTPVTFLQIYLTFLRAVGTIEVYDNVWRWRETMNEKCTLYLVVPCYNEQEVLTETNRQLLEKMTSLMERGVIHEKSRILYVNDGSKDQTWILIRKFHGENVICSGLTLSRNRGHQNAVLAGLMYAKEHCDVAITLDADLQDDINAIDEMLEKFKAGNDVVYGVRSSRKKDTFFKKTTAEGFYHMMKWMGVDIVFNHADYRWMNWKIIKKFICFCAE